MATFKPRHCQQLIINHIIDHPRCNIWGDPGIGKTSSSLTAMDILWLAGSRFRPALILAPKRVARDVWAQESDKWDELRHIRVSRVMGNRKEREVALATPADVYVMNYENVQWLVERLRENWPFRIVIADESTRLKGFRLRKGGKRAAALAKVAKATGRWVNLTGTPSPNGLIDLWGQTWFLDRGERLGRTFTAFKNRWFDENEYTREVTPRPNAEEEISRNLSDITLSLRAEDYFDLPEVLHNTLYIDLPKKARTWYDSMEATLFAEIEEGTVSAANGGVRSSKCLQIATGAVYTDEEGGWEEVHTEKMDALRGLLNDLAGEPLLCAYHYRPDRHRILREFPEAVELKSEKSIEDWNARRIPLGVVHPDSIGHGLNLAEGGRHLVFFGLWWALEPYLQLVERIGPTRQAQLGRKEPVMVHNIVARNTLDEAVLARREGKRSVQDALRLRLNAKR